MGNCFRRTVVDCEEIFDYSGGNVHVITDKTSYDEKIAQANEEGKIQSTKIERNVKQWCNAIISAWKPREHSLMKCDFALMNFLSSSLKKNPAPPAAIPFQESSVHAQYLPPAADDPEHLPYNTLQVVMNFSASWCSPCRVIAPLYAELSTRHPSLVFLTIDVDELAELSSSWNIHVTPTFLFLKDGNKLDMLEGSNKVELERKMVFFADSPTYQPQRIQDDVN